MREQPSDAGALSARRPSTEQRQSIDASSWLAGSLRWTVQIVLGATIASFGASVAFAHHSTDVLDERVLAISRDAMPAIEHLSHAHAELRVLELELSRAIERAEAGAPLDRTRLDAGLAGLHAELAAYLAIPLFPHEATHVRVAERAIAELESELATEMHHLALRDSGAALVMLRSSLWRAMSHTDVALSDLITFNAEEQRRLSVEIRADQLRATEVGYGLYGLSLLLALASLGLVLRNGRQYTLLLGEQKRSAERRANDLAAFSRRLEALAASSVAISNTITRSTDLRAMFRPIADHARSVVDAAACALRVRGDRDAVDAVVVSSVRDDVPPMGPTLTVPISRGELALRRGEGQPAFSSDDAHVAELFAAHVAVAIENARLFNEAQAAKRAREDLLAAVSHDLRSPLDAIQLAASLLREDLEGFREAHGLVARIDRSADRMSRLIRDLLAAAQIEAGRLSTEARREDARALIDEAVETIGITARERGVELTIEVPSVMIVCERHLVLRVLSNLLDNALKFTPKGGRITVTGTAREREVELAVRDTGRGIPAKDLEHVFDRYWQPARADRRGSGLGLFITRGIVEAHGGRIWVESTLGVGTTFSFTLPTP